MTLNTWFNRKDLYRIELMRYKKKGRETTQKKYYKDYLIEV